MFCLKISGIVINGKHFQDCVVFLDYSVASVMSDVLTKLFTFKCCRLVEDRPARLDPVVAMMTLQSSGDLHVPPVRARSVMMGKDIVNKEIRQYLKDN